MHSPAQASTGAPAPTSASAHTSTNAPAPASNGSKALWAAALVLGVVVLALGATLIRIQSQPIEPRMSVLPQPSQVASSANDGAASASTPELGSTPAAPDATSAAVSAAVTRTASAPATPTASAAVAATIANPATPVNPDFIEQNRPQALKDKAQAAIENIAKQTIEITDKPRLVLPRQPEPAVLRPPGMGASNTATPPSR